MSHHDSPLASFPAAWMRVAGALARAVTSGSTALLLAGGAGVALARCAERPRTAAAPRTTGQADSGRAAG
jgi:hypothetical protein